MDNLSSESTYMRSSDQNSKAIDSSNASKILKSPTLGLEVCANDVFNETAAKINSLTASVEAMNKNNATLKDRVDSLLKQRDAAYVKNDKLEGELYHIKMENDQLISDKNSSKGEIGNYKKEFKMINVEYEMKKKLLEHEINLLVEANREANEELRKENISYEQVQLKYKQENNKICNEIAFNMEQIEKYRTILEFMKSKEQQSLTRLNKEVNQFRQAINGNNDF